MQRIHTAGMFLFDGAEKFTLRGVSYGPFRPNQAGEQLPEPADFRRDLQLIRAAGVPKTPKPREIIYLRSLAI